MHCCTTALPLQMMVQVISCCNVQVVYGQKCLLQDDFSGKEVQAVSSVVIGKSSQHRQDQLTVYNAVHARVEQYAAHLLRQNYLKGLQRWHGRAEASVQRNHRDS